jgi:hypothetical protein
MRRHEVDRLWGGVFSGKNDVAFVLTVFVIDQNDHTSSR